MDPGTIIAVSQIFFSAVSRLNRLWGSLHDAPTIVADIAKSCDMIKTMLENATQNLARMPEDDKMTVMCRDVIEQLTVDVNSLVDKLPTAHDSAGKELKVADRVATAFGGDDLIKMHKKILDKSQQLQMVLQEKANGQFHESIKELLQGRRRHSTSSSSGSSLLNNQRGGPPDRNAQASLIVALKRSVPNSAEIQSLLQTVNPNFYFDPSEFRRGDGSSVSSKGEASTPLHLAAQKGNLNAIEDLIHRGAEVNALSQPRRRTPLMSALCARHSMAAYALLSHGADPALPDSDGQTALHVAARSNLYPVAHLLLAKGADANAAANRPSGQTPLAAALERYDRDVVPRDTNVLQILLDYGADPTFSGDRHTPLHQAAKKDYRADLEVLVRHVAAHSPDRWRSPSVRNNHGMSPLWLAAKNGNVEAVRVLLAHGADANERFSEWSQPDGLRQPNPLIGAQIATRMDPAEEVEVFPSPLWAAVGAGSVEAVEALLDKGADPTILGRDPHSPGGEARSVLHLAARMGYGAIARLLLRRSQVDVNAKDGAEGMTSLMLAAKGGFLSLVKDLVLDHGADVVCRNKHGCDALYYASAWGHGLVVSFLLARGADINGPTKKGNTPLHFAALRGEADMVRVLLDLGADKNARSREPFQGLAIVGTPADIAKELGHKEIVNILEAFNRQDGKARSWIVTMRSREAG